MSLRLVCGKSLERLRNQIFDGKKLSYQVIFDQNDNVASHQLLSMVAQSQTQVNDVAQ